MPRAARRRPAGLWLAGWGTCFLAASLLTATTTGRSSRRSRSGARIRVVAECRPAHPLGVRLGARCARHRAAALGGSGPDRTRDADAAGVHRRACAPVDAPGVLARTDGSTSRARRRRRRHRGALERPARRLPGFAESLDTRCGATSATTSSMRVRAAGARLLAGPDVRRLRRSFLARRQRPRAPARRSQRSMCRSPSATPQTSSGVASSRFVQTYFVEDDQPNVVFAAYRPDAGDLRRRRVATTRWRVAVRRRADRRARSTRWCPSAPEVTADRCAARATCGRV